MTTSPSRTYPNEAALRYEAVKIAHHACDGTHGRTFGDPIFEEVTEGRQKYKGYSACGDLAHYVLRELGFRDEQLLNRNDDGGVVPWQIGRNIARIVYGAGSAFVWAQGNVRPSPGDVLYMSKPEHVAILASLDETAGNITLCEYGQWDASAGKPSGRCRTTTFVIVDHVLRVGKRTLHGWLDLSRLPGMIAA